jgi:hypothetical protein
MDIYSEVFINSMTDELSKLANDSASQKEVKKGLKKVKDAAKGAAGTAKGSTFDRYNKEEDVGF